MGVCLQWPFAKVGNLGLQKWGIWGCKSGEFLLQLCPISLCNKHDEEDAFVVIQLEEPEKLGYTYTNIDDKHPIALFKALISARDDIYPLEYLLKPQFLLRKDERYLLIEKGLWCSINANIVL
ncbi:hypothetical protein L1N85_21815 [Paenibacillus alkaliterrae]|uniref:hypothetical protein n=1 Tax=Paenibacillus alkaliterrae TaxID=320909 RepID=UPI001F3CFC69|nr:hypothetical protein [Paenibacillus alkaliterrae]MCF2941027.1 hypothetical protein [Paenibacillus alkaliterrae]